MGQQIALQCAMHGYDVTVYELSSDVLRDATAKVRAYAEGLVDKKRLTPSTSGEAPSRITFTSKRTNNSNNSISTRACSASKPERASTPIQIRPTSARAF